jgi:hypothetical protein
VTVPGPEVTGPTRGPCATLLGMDLVVAFNHQTGTRVAELGFLLIAFSGIWLVAGELSPARLGKARTIVAGIALALAGILLIIATHWGQYN